MKLLNNSFTNLEVCELNNYTFKICESGAKFYHFFIEKGFTSLKTFDLLLLYSFIITFIAFSITIIFIVFEPEHLVSKNKKKGGKINFVFFFF